MTGARSELLCRLEHQGPTSDEVGMQRAERSFLFVGCSIKDAPLTRWVCRANSPAFEIQPEVYLLSVRVFTPNPVASGYGVQSRHADGVYAIDYTDYLPFPRTSKPAQKNGCLYSSLTSSFNMACCIARAAPIPPGAACSRSGLRGALSPRTGYFRLR